MLNGRSNDFDGLFLIIHFVMVTAYHHQILVLTDSTTGEWKIKTSPSVSYGTNGFFFLKDGNGVTDQSANSNNFDSKWVHLQKQKIIQVMFLLH